MTKVTKIKKESGQILIICVVLGAILVTLSAALMGYTSLHVKGSRQSVALNQALQIAEAGLDKAVYELNQSSSYTGETGTVFGNGEFTISVVDVDSSTKRVTSIGYVPNSVSPTSIRTVKSSVYINTSAVAFNFGVQVGEGGLTMSNNATVNGNVFSNGNISGSNGSTIAGDASVGSGVSATPDQECTAYGDDFAFSNHNSTRDIAQKFTPTVSGSLTKVSIYIKKGGTPSGVPVVRIMPHNSSSNKPQSSGQIGGNGTFSSIGTTYGWIDVSFSSAPSLVAGTTYWIVLDNSSNYTPNYYMVGVDSSYGCSGEGKFSSSYSWSAATWNPIDGSPGADINYKTYFGGTTTTLSGVTVTGSARAQAMSNCTVNGNAYFEGSSTNCTVGGSQNPNTAAPPPQAMPVSSAQIADWKTEAENGGVINGNYTVSGTQTLGQRKINGNLVLTNSSVLYVTGAIWVTGTITLSNGGIIRVDNSLGNSGTVVLADGAVNVSNGVTISGNGSPNSYLMLLTTATGSSAMSIGNNAAGAIFYAANGTINVSNNAGAAQITGYAISMSNNATVNYSTGLQSATFSTGPGGAWSYLTGSYVIVK